MGDRALEHFPSVLLTLISIIQALALELLWSKIVESDFLFTLDRDAILGWGMISVTLLGIIQIWVMYSCMVMGFRWMPSLRDSIFPFIIGIQQFMLVSLISDDFSGSWLYVLASLFVTGNVITHLSFRKARKNSANRVFFKDRSPATWKDFKWAYAVIGTLSLFGLLTDLYGTETLLPLVAILFANGFLLVQIITMRSMWQVIIDLPPDPT
jgi:hypothetical protein